MASLPESIARRIGQLRDDNTRGATSLTSRAGEIFHDWAVGMPQLTRAAAVAQLTVLATSLCRAQPMMAPIIRLCSELLFAADRASSSAAIAQTVMALSRQFVEQLQARLDTVAREAAQIIPDMGLILTHSSSSTVLEALLQAAEQGKRVRVFCTESRPMREGVALARRLNSAGIPTTLLVDSAAYTVIPSIQMILVGCDAIAHDELVNKVGTYGIALGARSMNKPLYALCDSTKFLPASYALPQEHEHDPKEVLRTPLPGISTLNLYFDRTPLELLAGIVTEEGLLTVSDVKERLARTQIHPLLLSAS